MSIYDAMRDELSAMTMAQIKEVAKSEGITLGYAAARKSTAVEEIIMWRRSRDMRKKDVGR